jgi:hypothetical protein
MIEKMELMFKAIMQAACIVVFRTLVMTQGPWQLQLLPLTCGDLGVLQPFVFMPGMQSQRPAFIVKFVRMLKT